MFQKLTNSLMSFLYLTASFSGLVRATSPRGQDSELSKIIIHDASRMQMGVKYTPENLFKGMRQIFEDDDPSKMRSGIETLRAFDKLFVKGNEKEDGMWLQIPKLGDEYKINIGIRDKHITIYESQIYVFTLRISELMLTSSKVGKLEDYQGLRSTLEDRGILAVGKSADLIARGDLVALLKGVLICHAVWTDDIVKGRQHDQQLIKDYDHLEFALRKIFQLEQTESFPDAINYARKIVGEMVRGNMVKPETIVKQDEEFSFYNYLISVIVVLTIIGVNEYRSLMKSFSSMSDEMLQDYIEGRRVRGPYIGKSIRKAAFDEFVRRQKTQQVEVVREKKVYKKSEREYKTREVVRTQVREFKPEDYVSAPKVEVVKPPKPKLTDKNEKELESKIREIFSRKHEKFKQLASHKINQKIQESDREQFFDLKASGTEFKLNLEKVIKFLVHEANLISTQKSKVKDSEIIREILSQYQQVETTEIPDAQASTEQSNPQIEAIIVDDKDEDEDEEEVPATQHLNVVMAPIPKGKGKLTITQNRENIVAELLNVKYSLLKRINDIYLAWKKHPDDINKLLDQPTLSIIRHGLIHMDLKMTEVSELVRRAYYQDTLNRLTVLGDLTEINTLGKAIELNTHHEIFGIFESHAIAWHKDHAQHIELDFEQAMGMIEACKISLKDPMVVASEALTSMLLTEMGEIYQQLRNSDSFSELLKSDPHYALAIAARNQFGHEGIIEEKVKLAFNS